MIEINLIPSGAAARRAPAGRSLRPGGAGLPKLGADPRMAGLAVAALLLVVLSAFTFWKTGTRRAELTEQVAREEAEAARLRRTIAMLETLRARQDTMGRKIDVIRSVDGRRYVWPHLLDEVSRAVPQYTWLTKVAVIDEPEPAPAAAPAPGAAADSAKADSAAAAAAAPVVPAGPAFNLEGNAANTQALTRFMKNLEASPMIRGVALITSEQTENQGRTYTRFTLEARFEEPDSALLETVPVIPVP